MCRVGVAIRDGKGGTSVVVDRLCLFWFGADTSRGGLELCAGGRGAGRTRRLADRTHRLADSLSAVAAR